MKYKIEKFLSEGMMGKVYLVSKYGKKYAMKIEYLSDINDLYFQTELKFVKEVASKHPDHFMQLLDYQIDTNCKEESPELPDWLSDEQKDYLINLRSSGICAKKIYSLIDTSLNKLPIEEMTIKERYSMLIQVLYINYLIEHNGFVHGDFHKGNIGVIKVDKEKILDIFGKRVPTFGNQYVAIDYGGILHKNNVSSSRKYQFDNRTEREHFDEHIIVDKLGIINSMIDAENFWKYVGENKIKLDFEKDLKLILSQDEIKLLKDVSNIKYILFDLYRILFTKKFQMLVLGNKFEEKIPFVCHIPSIDILFAFTNFHNSEKLINYFIARLENV